jgi:hypothetical protein
MGPTPPAPNLQSNRESGLASACIFVTAYPRHYCKFVGTSTDAHSFDGWWAIAVASTHNIPLGSRVSSTSTHAPQFSTQGLGDHLVALKHSTTFLEITPWVIMACLSFVFLRVSSTVYWPWTDTTICLQLSLLSSLAANPAYSYIHQKSHETILSTIDKASKLHVFAAPRHCSFQWLWATSGMTESRQGGCDKTTIERRWKCFSTGFFHFCCDGSCWDSISFRGHTKWLVLCLPCPLAL